MMHFDLYESIPTENEEMLLSLLDAFKTINVVLKDYFCASEVKSRIRVSSTEGFPATLRSTLPVLLENGLL